MKSLATKPYYLAKKSPLLAGFFILFPERSKLIAQLHHLEHPYRMNP